MTTTRTRRTSTTPMPTIDALATVAESILTARGQMASPTLHDITLAVVQACPLLEITMNENAANIQIAATDKLVQKHKWDIGKVVLLTSGFKMNGYQHTQENKPKRNDDGPPRGASR